MTRQAIDWFEIPAADLERAVAFYERIFGFRMTPLELGNGLRMALFPAEPPRSGGGALCQHPDFYSPCATGTLVYLNADPDLSVVLERIPGAGGKVLVPRRMVSPDFGYMAVFLDCEGNRVALHSSR